MFNFCVTYCIPKNINKLLVGKCSHEEVLGNIYVSTKKADNNIEEIYQETAKKLGVDRNDVSILFVGYNY